jgi:hypothetical protein
VRSVLASLLVIAFLAACFGAGYIGVRYEAAGEQPLDALDDLIDDAHLR